MKKVASIEIKPIALVLEGSWGSRDVGTHASTMELWLSDDGKKGLIEWDIPKLRITEEIGVWFDGRKLRDYDGVCSLPKEAATFLRSQGYTVGREFSP